MYKLMSSKFSFDSIYKELILSLTFSVCPFLSCFRKTHLHIHVLFQNRYMYTDTSVYTKRKEKEPHLLHLRNTEDKRNIKVFMFFFWGSNRKDMRLERRSKIKFLKSSNEIFSVTHYWKRQSKFWGYLHITENILLYLESRRPYHLSFITSTRNVL